MRTPMPPTLGLSGNGDVMVWELGDRAGAVDLTHESGERHDFDVDDLCGMAVSPSGSRIALTTDEHLIVVQRTVAGGPWKESSRHAVGEPMFQLAVADEGVVAGVTARENGGDNSVFMFDGNDGVERPLGNAVVFDLLLDGPRRRLLLAGQSGDGSLGGNGDPFVRLYEWDEFDTAMSVVWEGPAPVDQPNGWVMPITFGDIGVHDLERLVVISPESNPDDIGEVVDELSFGHLETVVGSPDGRHIGWFWFDESNSTTVHVRTARLADGTVVEQPDVGGVGESPIMAVGDDGALTIVDVARPASANVHRLVDGLVDSWTVAFD